MISRISWISFLFCAFCFIHCLKQVRRSANCANRVVYSPGLEDPLFGVITNHENETFNCEWLLTTANLNSNKFINIRLVSIDFDCQSDILYIFDGNSYEHPLIGSLSGASPLETFASSGSLFVLQYSDFAFDSARFKAEFSFTDCPLNCSGHGNCANNRCVCNQYWTGAACQTELCSNNCSYSGYCLQASVADSCFIQTEHRCDCLTDYIGQSCSVVKSDYFNPRDLLQWKVLFENDQLFSSRASHASVYDATSDTIFTFGGRNYDTVLADLLSYTFADNKWHNLTKCDKGGHTHPKPLWGHTLNIFNIYLVLFGGFSHNGHVSNELWLYSLGDKSWSRKDPNQAIPGLAFHTATIVDHEWLYVIGGRLKNGLYSSSIHRINLIDGFIQWQAIHPRNRKPPSVAGHSAAFYPTLRSIVVFGGISSSSQLTNSLHLYNVDQNVWSTLVFKPEESVIPTSRVFHSMLIWDNYLIVFGGFTTGSNGNKNIDRCEDSQIYLYCFTCQKWIDFDWLISLQTSIKPSAFPTKGMYSHTMVRRDNLLVVLGGFSNRIRNEVLANSFPKSLSQVDLCAQITSKSICNGVHFCFWCPQQSTDTASQCLHRELKCPTKSVQLDSKCPGLCSRLHDCYSCLAVSKGDYGDNHTGSHSLCSWNAIRLICTLNTDPSDESGHIVRKLANCKQDNIQAGITVLKYYYPHNYSEPDEVNFLSNSNVRLVFPETKKFSPSSNEMPLFNVARILGYIHPLGIQAYNDNWIRLYLSSSSPSASLHVNGITRSLKNSQKKSTYTSTIDLNNTGDLIGNGHFIDYLVKFPVRIRSKKLDYERVQINFDPQVEELVEWTPYHDWKKCSMESTCTGCLANTACAWCSNGCVLRSNSSECKEALIIDPVDCISCEQHSDCAECIGAKEQTCEWLLKESLCVRAGRGSLATRNQSLCPVNCHERKSCESCLDESLHCMWCESSHLCIHSTAYYSSSPYEYCHQLDTTSLAYSHFHFNQKFLTQLNVNYSQVQCHKCLRHSVCSMCQSDANCEWCYFPSDPSHGLCALRNETNQCHFDSNPSNVNFVRLNQSCPNIDECQLGLHNCHHEATCVDTNHSFRCVCKHGFTGNGITCIQTCNTTCVHGYCSDFPDYRCICDLGWTGSECNIDCGCNYHSTCHHGVGVCDQCEDNTRDKFCDQCVVGAFGNATDSKGCQLCTCNQHGNVTLGTCHPQSGICYCTDHTEGIHCERCAAGYYGNPKDGNNCFIECNHRTLISEVTFGYFGSYIRDIHFGKFNHLFDRNHFFLNTNVHCLWIFTTFASPNNYHSLESYFETINRVAQPIPVSVSIFHSMNVNCSTSSVIVYDGLPRFISASNKTESTILANLCGVNSPKNIQLTATSGFATVLYISDDLHQGFNASYQRMPVQNQTTVVPYENRTESVAISSEFKEKLYIESIWKYNSSVDTFGSWPKIIHTVEHHRGNLIFIGGFLDTPQLTLTAFDLKHRNWWKPNQSNDSRLVLRHFHASAMINNTIFVYGGLNHVSNQVLNDFWSCTIDEDFFFVWKRLTASAMIPPLIGHSITNIHLLSEDVILLIGGYSPTNGLLDRQYIYSPVKNEWSILETKGAAPIGILAHSTVYHPSSHSVYLFGGVDFKESQKIAISNTLYILDLNNLIWHRIQPTNVNHRHFPLPRYLHVAASTENYMIIFGGRTHNPSDKTFQISTYAYSFRCNQWLSLNNNSFWNSPRPHLHMFQAVSVASSDDQLMYLYQATMTPSISSTFSESINAVRLPSDLCILFSANQNECLNMLGCSYCSTSAGSVCFDSSGSVPEACGEVKDGHSCKPISDVPDCTSHTNCVDCTIQNYRPNLDEDLNCQWCSDCRHKEGRCIRLNDTCDTSELNYHLDSNYCQNVSMEYPFACPLQRCLATDCDKCMQYSLLNSNSHYKHDCVWTRQVYKFIRFGHTLSPSPVFDWACIESSIIEATLQLSDLETVPPLFCPARCHKHTTCSLCLDEASGDESGSHECVWSELTHECMSPTYALLRCEHGLCGGFVHRRLHSQCPLSCETYKKASECLATLHCGWCSIDGFAVDGIGICMKGGLFGPINGQCASSNRQLLDRLTGNSFYKPITHFTTKWHYLYPPKENECLNGHHSCDRISQECIDLEDGFMCRCKSGFKMLENVCKPICHQGCIFGVCMAPEVCRCNFGFIGEDCSLECQCHGHSTCPSADRLSECLECHNNTQGQHCEQCQPFYVGDPLNSGTCQSCHEYCNNHSGICLSENSLNSSFISTTDSTFWYELGKSINRGPTSNAICVDCKNNTEGERCDRCKLGYFKISDDIRDGCRKCMCNGHGFICNPFNGENCNCHNNTENDRQCNYLNSKEYSNYINKTYYFKSSQAMTTFSLPCFMLQCSKCKDYFYGTPTNGHQCYRHMYIDKEYCFDPISQDDCLQKPKPLLHGRTVYFAIQPRYMNVDIKIIVYLIQGDIDLYISPKDDFFIVHSSPINGFHQTFVDYKYIQPNFDIAKLVDHSNYTADPTNKQQQHYYDQQLEDSVVCTDCIPLLSSYRLQVVNVQNDYPYYHSIDSLNDVVLFRNIRNRLEITIPYKVHDLRTTRFYIIVRGNSNNSITNSSHEEDGNYGNITFRQDQCRIDLFIFFSVFFSCFFFFLSLSIVMWKFKQVADNRQAQIMHEIELEHMASRPFAKILILVDDWPLFKKSEAPFRKTSTKSTSQSVQSTPAKKLSLFQQLTMGFKESPKVHPETSVVKTSYNQAGQLKPVSVEPTNDGLAAILTTFVRLPGENLALNQISAASTLVSLKHSPHLMPRPTSRHTVANSQSP